MRDFPDHLDLIIVGGGPVGGALALLLAHRGWQVGVLEARQQPAQDSRALAVAHASRQTLADLGVWPQAAATPIHTVHVSQQQAFGRVKLSDADLGLPALGYVLPYADLATAIHAKLAEQPGGVHYLTGAQVSGLKSLDGYAVVTVNQGGQERLLTTRLAVLAEGGKLLAGSGIGQSEHDYQQQAVVAEVWADTPHRGQAFERFALDGPIAMLPKQDHYALVWTRPANDPLAVLGLPDAAFLAALQDRMGDRAGLLTRVGKRAAFPLRLKWADAHHGRRIAVVGNAAQTLHPVAGQGFNLGLRDAITLARVIAATPQPALGDADMLARYAALRQRDSLATVGFTDGLIRLFGMESLPVRHLRAAGLLALDNLQPLRRGFAQRMVFGTA